MTRARALIDELASSGVTLRVDGDSIVHRGPKSAMTPKVLAKLRRHKSELIAELQPRAEVGLGSTDISEVKPGPQPMGAAALRCGILAALDRLPAVRTTSACQLLTAETKAFLSSRWWTEAIELGWSLEELFGMDCRAPDDFASWGVVVGLAMAPMPGDIIEMVDADRVVIKFRSRRTGNEMRRVDMRFPPALSSVPWWECVSMLEDDVRGRCPPGGAVRLPAPETSWVADDHHLAPPDDGSQHLAGCHPIASRRDSSLRPMVAMLDRIRRALRRVCRLGRHR